MALSTLVLPLLVLLLPPVLRDYLSPAHVSKDAGVIGEELHPVVLVPGLGCSDLEARLTEAYQPSSAPRCGTMKGKGWFELWKNASDLVDHNYVQCFLKQMRLVYDPAVNDYRNLPGVETRVPNFGSAAGFRNKDPLHPKRCFDKVREALERLGYRDGDTLFGATYDWRHAPPVPGQRSQVYSLYFQQLKELVEAASKKRQGKKKAIIMAHSYGGMVALEFVRNAPLWWRSRHIKHLILVAPALSAGFLQQALALAAGPGQMIYVPDAADGPLRTLWRSLETAIADLPSPEVFGHEPVVVTKRKNYSAHDMEDLLAAIGFRDGVEPFRRRMAPKMRYSKAPMVPMRCINGVGVRTPRQLVFWESDYDTSPEIVYGDGDGFVNLASILAFDRVMRGQPGQKEQFKSVKIDKVQHSELVEDEWALNQVMQEFLEANR